MTASRVAIVGARGYSGLELVRILLRHPNAQLIGVFANEKSFELSHYLSENAAKAIPTWALAELEVRSKEFDVLFLATPAEASIELANKAVSLGKQVIDLSGAFRLKNGDIKANYKQWYALEHPATGLVESAQYGLSPWKNVSGNKLVSNPGCYATSVLMAIIPLLRGGAIEPSSLVIDAKSGTSGAGRKASESLLFTEVDGECLPYKVGGHQHWPEIQEAALTHSGVEISPFFTTHLLNVRRGIISSIYARLNPAFVGATDQETDQRLEGLFAEAYANYPLVRFGSLGKREADSLLSLKRVVGTARTHIAFKASGDKLHLFSLIDNLLKGAASQAVENFNQLIGAPVDTGLSNLEGVL